MTSSTPRAPLRILFLLFLLSGFCGLAYQVVWLRLAFASFGIITPVMSVVISVFMLGLGLGSWCGGRWIRGWTARTGVSAIFFYAAAEVTIGLGAFAVPVLFRAGEQVLLPLGGMGSASYLTSSALILGASILPWCLAMGATFPLMMQFVRELDEGEQSSFSFLYFANVVGAMAGVLLTAVVLIETLGFRSTLLVAALFNFSVAAISVGLGLHRTGQVPAAERAPAAAGQDVGHPSPAAARFALAILFTTGFCAMALEVIWTRAFVPVLGTLVYSFALLLFVYLLATWVGSWLYRTHLAAGSVASTSRLLAGLAVAALVPVVLNDPRLGASAFTALASIFPLCAGLGYLTPKLVDRYGAGQPDRAGFAYAINVLGSILGPLFACYLLLPAVGARLGMVGLALPFLALLAPVRGSRALDAGWRILTGGAVAALLLCAVFVSRSLEEGGFLGDAEVRRDHTATVISFGTGMRKGLLVNGVGITELTPLAKVMGHLPLAFLPREPESAAVICMGMGTTFRSLMSWDIDTTVVELAGGVVDAFPFYFDDAEELLQSPRANVAVDDGRRFLQRSGERFDVITIDPPPPAEAAGSSLLYSNDFYDLVKTSLSDDGILQQWFPGGGPKVAAAVTRSLVDSFPHVKVFRGYDGRGLHFLASLEPLETPSPAEFVRRMAPGARLDLVEWNEERYQSPDVFVKIVLENEFPVSRLLDPDPDVRITDDRPFNEYFLLRRSLDRS